MPEEVVPLPCQRYQEKRCTSSKYSEVIIFTPRPPQGGEKEEDYIHPAKFSEVRWLVAPSRGAEDWAGLLNCLGKAWATVGQGVTLVC